MISIYGRILNETDSLYVFAPATRLEADPPFSDAIVFGKAGVSVVRNAAHGLDKVLLRGRCRKSPATSPSVSQRLSRWTLQEAAPVPRRQLQLFR